MRRRPACVLSVAGACARACRAGRFDPIDLVALRITDPDLRTLLQGWLGHVFIATDLAQALAGRATLPPGCALVVREGHVVDAQSVRFYAPDSEQAGLLGRQQEIENLQREIQKHTR